MPTLALALIPRAVALNLVLGLIVQSLKLPLYLDSVGTVLVAALVGPWAAVVTGIASNTVLGLLSSPTFFAFIPVTVAIGLLAGLAGRLGAFRSVPGSIVAGLVIGIVGGATSVPIVLTLFGGVTASGTGIVTLVLRAMHLPLWLAAGIASVASDILDKVVSCLLVMLVVARLPTRLAARFAGARAA